MKSKSKYSFDRFYPLIKEANKIDLVDIKTLPKEEREIRWNERNDSTIKDK